LADRWGRARVLVLGHLSLVGAYALAALPLGGASLAALLTMASLVALGAFYAASDGVTAAVAGRLVPPGVRASGIAAAQTVVAVARLVASTVFGALWFLLGPSTALVLVGGLLLAVVAAVLPVMVRLDSVADAS
jgi:hypothetical protein